MEILNIQSANDSETVLITIGKENGEKMNIYVKIIDGLYRPNLGCIIHTDEPYSILDEDDLDDPDNDIEIIIKEAENFIQSLYKIERINSDYVLKIFDDKVVFSKINHNFISINASPHQLKYHDIKTFNTLEEAKIFIEPVLEKDD